MSTLIAIQPTVSDSVTPSLNERVKTSASIQATFSLDLDPATVNIQNIIFEDSNGDSVKFRTLNSPIDTITLVPDEILEPDGVYEIIFTTNIKNYLGANISQYVVKFITETIESYNELISESLLKNHLAVYRSHWETKDLLNIDYMLKEGSEFNYSYNPTDYDPLTKTYTKDKSVVLSFDVSNFVKEKFKSQYLSDYSEYLDNIKQYNTLSDADFLAIEKFIYNNTLNLATGSGIKKHIETMLKYYGLSLNRHYVDVQPDPNNRLVYHVVTSIEIDHWNKTLKNILHPLSLEVKYREIPDYVFRGTEISNVDVTISDNTLTNAPLVLAQGDQVSFKTSLNIPSELEEDTLYYVINYIDGSFELTTTRTQNNDGTFTYGDSIYFTDYGFGSHTVILNNRAYKVSFSNTNKVDLRPTVFVDNERVHFETTNTLPSPISLSTTYYVVNSSGTTYQVSLSEGGSPISIDNIGEGTLNVRQYHMIQPSTFDWEFNQLFDQYIDENTENDIIQVKNNLRWFNTFVFNYLQASNLGKVGSQSRFFEYGREYDWSVLNEKMKVYQNHH